MGDIMFNKAFPQEYIAWNENTVYLIMCIIHEKTIFALYFIEGEYVVHQWQNTLHRKQNIVWTNLKPSNINCCMELS
jgi:hypothetical protein